jgi:hypothetical protein
MAPQSDKNDFTAAWRALAGSNTADGWKTIPITTRLRCRLLAARHFPGNEEAIIIGFRSIRNISGDHLPEGSGFIVRPLDDVFDSHTHRWIALLRQPAGSLEIFTMMSLDIVSTLELSHAENDDQLLGKFLSRIRAWQKFMQHAKDGVLSPEAEIGLHGELIILGSLLTAGILPHDTLNAWQGPREGLHDFQFGRGSLEVKTTLSQKTFPATISSLEQMDNRMVGHLYLAGVRLQKDENGKNLKERIDELKAVFNTDSTLGFSFEVLLIHAGYLSSMSFHYSRKFSHVHTMYFHVDDDFPKLIRDGVPNEVINAHYQLDLDKLTCPCLSLDDVLRTLGEL